MVVSTGIIYLGEFFMVKIHCIVTSYITIWLLIQKNLYKDLKHNHNTIITHKIYQFLEIITYSQCSYFSDTHFLFFFFTLIEPEFVYETSVRYLF